MLITITGDYWSSDFSDLPASLTDSAKRPKVEQFLRDEVLFGDSVEGGSGKREITTAFSKLSVYLKLYSLK